MVQLCRTMSNNIFMTRMLLISTGHGTSLILSKQVLESHAWLPSLNRKSSKITVKIAKIRKHQKKSWKLDISKISWHKTASERSKIRSFRSRAVPTPWIKASKQTPRTVYASYALQEYLLRKGSRQKTGASELFPATAACQKPRFCVSSTATQSILSTHPPIDIKKTVVKESPAISTLRPNTDVCSFSWRLWL